MEARLITALLDRLNGGKGQSLPLSPRIKALVEFLYNDMSNGLKNKEYDEICCEILTLLATDDHNHAMMRSPEMGIVPALVHMCRAIEPEKEKYRKLAESVLLKLGYTFEGSDILRMLVEFENHQNPVEPRKGAAESLKQICQMDEYKTLMASKKFGYLAALFKELDEHSKIPLSMRNSSNAAYSSLVPTQMILESFQSLAKTKHPETFPMASRKYEYLAIIADEIRSKDRKSLNVTIACSLICTLLAYDRRNAEHIIAAGLHEVAINFLKTGPKNPNNWGGNNTAEGWSMYVILLCASRPEFTAEALQSAGALDAIGPLIAHNHISSLMTAISIAFLSCTLGREATESLLVESHSRAIERVVDLLDDALHNRKGPGYGERTFMLSMVSRAVRSLILSDTCREALIKPRLINLLREIVDLFAKGMQMGNEATEGGDIECINAALDSLAHLASECLGFRNSASFSPSVFIELRRLRSYITLLCKCPRYDLLEESSRTNADYLLSVIETQTSNHVLDIGQVGRRCDSSERFISPRTVAVDGSDDEVDTPLTVCNANPVDAEAEPAAHATGTVFALEHNASVSSVASEPPQALPVAQASFSILPPELPTAVAVPVPAGSATPTTPPTIVSRLRLPWIGRAFLTSSAPASGVH